MGNHTEEPWEWWTANMTFVGSRPDYGEDWERSVLVSVNGYREIAESNARRIAACVNACAGIPTEALEECARYDAAIERLDTLSAYEKLREWEVDT